jgi:hypothetical protein
MKDTNLILSVAPLPPTFSGTPQQMFAALVRRSKIVSPSGINFIYIGDTEPTSNVGPWLRGTKWYVFDDSIKRYVPLDITDSEKTWYHIGATARTRPKRTPRAEMRWAGIFGTAARGSLTSASC